VNKFDTLFFPFYFFLHFFNLFLFLLYVFFYLILLLSVYYSFYSFFSAKHSLFTFLYLSVSSLPFLFCLSSVSCFCDRSFRAELAVSYARRAIEARKQQKAWKRLTISVVAETVGSSSRNVDRNINRVFALPFDIVEKYAGRIRT